ncbi:hypothetical protein ZU61_04655, partial [Salmonella enterica subsp. enterica serovar Thompson]|nr:hypothetical protein [Salmonella enterica subsp. enterica serovar Thompson]
RLLEIRRRRHDAAEGGEPEVIRFSYDSAGNLLSEETAQGVLQNRYDVQGNRTETQMPDGRTLRYLYYGSGHLQQINLGRDVISEFTRDHLHREVQRSQGRLDTRRMYDRTGRLTRKLTCKGMRGVVPETFIDREYAYSGQDELLKKRHSRQGVTDYFYDTTGRITACRNEAYLDSWQYDAAANLLDRRQGETAQAGAGSVVPFNRITSYRGLHYRYDEYGRVVEKRGRNGTQHYRWDAEHRLTEVAVIRGSTVRRYGYVYDAPGRRVEKHELDAEGKPYNRTTFLWDGMRLAQECRLGRSSSLYIYSDQGSHEPLARVDRAAPGEADEVLYYHTDVNGAPEEMTDGGGNIVWEAGYQVWGNLTHEKETRPVQQNLRFQGQYLDRETGLHYNLYRFYDPDIGKFISGDPIGLAGGINLYQYAPNPLSYIDPLGLCKKFAGKGSPAERARNYRSTGQVGGKRNIATSNYNINGQTGTADALSGMNTNNSPFLHTPADGSRKFTTFEVGHDRAFDSEVKIFEYIANKFPTTAKGRIDLYSELKVCPSCSEVITQFKAMYPNIEVNVTWGG